MEKQANKLNNLFHSKNITSAVIFILFLVGFNTINAQDRIPFDDGKVYIIKKINVTGKITYSPETIATFSGLEKGQSITIPGEEISNSIKKLWKLNLYNDVNFYVDKIEGDSISLELNLNEHPKLKEVKYVGLRKSKIEEISKKVELVPEAAVNENLITNTRNYIENKYKKDGYYNTKVNIATTEDKETINHVNMVVNVDKGSKVKISEIKISGNSQLSDKKIRKAMKNTKQQSLTHIFKKSKFIKEKYNEDLESIISKYKEKGYRDARIVTDSVVYDKVNNKIAINLNVNEGNKYYFGDIKYLGNTIYSDQLLAQVLGIKKGDVYNGVLLEKRINDKSAPDSEDLTNLYQNNGYLFSNINPVEVSTAKDTINMEIRVVEGPLTYFNKISVVGNDKTYDRVIYRELRTKPGEIYSKDNLVRTIREIGQLGFFDAEAIRPDIENPDPQAGTVDVKYNVVEKGASQIELQGGYGGGGFIGTLGLSFNNFSMRNLFNKEAYHPLPMGDGQKLSLRLQVSQQFQNYSFSFSEPWFGGKKPISLSSSISFTKQFGFSNTGRADKSKFQNIYNFSIGIAKRLQVPDDFFTISHALSYQQYELNNFFSGLFTFGNGSSKNIAYTIGLSRNSKGVNPIFPTYGSEFSVSGKFTPPFSLWNKVDYKNLQNLEENKIKNTVNRSNVLDGNGNIVAIGDYLDANNNKVTDPNLAAIDVGKIDQKKFNWLEYYKIKFKAELFTKVYGKLVLRTLGEFGYLGAYNQDRGVVPFERYILGGSGLGGNFQTFNENVQLRGYKDGSLSLNGQNSGDPIYNKFTLELRYPITLKQAASIYALAFAEGGASYNDFKTYDPFALKRSLGAGLRVFMPAFGLLGIDFGYGFDTAPGSTVKNGWEPHFIIGQQF